MSDQMLALSRLTKTTTSTKSTTTITQRTTLTMAKETITTISEAVRVETKVEVRLPLLFLFVKGLQLASGTGYDYD